ncbi:GNAT family N-acetyltransferase [Paenibacillus nanensis]|nr:GNAT family N-acetyltransferase [Paenibacillus nanensis]
MLLTRDIAVLLEQSEMDYMRDRMKAMMEMPGNPNGAEMRAFNSALAVYCRSMPWPMFNNVKGKLEPEQLEPIIAFYRERERVFEFQVMPKHADPEVLIELARKGFYQSGFHSTLFTEAQPIEAALPEGITIRALQDHEFMQYAAIHCEATGLPLEGQHYVAENNRIVGCRPGWRYYIALCDDEPAAVAVMYAEGKAASCTFAATLPKFRGRGLQLALLRRRIRDAYAAGCELVVAQCAYGSSSHANMERAGMRLGYTRATWKPLVT